MSKNSDPASHNTSRSATIARHLVCLGAPLGALAMILAPQSAGAAPAYTPDKVCPHNGAGVDWGGNWVDGWMPRLTVDPQNLDPTISVDQLLGANGKPRQEAAWRKIRGEVTCMLGSAATLSGTEMQVVADVGVPRGASSDDIKRASLQAAELTDEAAGQLTTVAGGGPAEAYQTEGLNNMVLFVTVNKPGTAPAVDFSQAVQPYPVSYGQRLAGYPPVW